MDCRSKVVFSHIPFTGQQTGSLLTVCPVERLRKYACSVYSFAVSIIVIFVMAQCINACPLLFSLSLSLSLTNTHTHSHTHSLAHNTASCTALCLCSDDRGAANPAGPETDAHPVSALREVR